ncbi:hypothetical protein J7E96_08760 [Streptomyces sp. ISL-96]|nr:hypothetical protein [Streptomyces sp. ISL-96]
MQQCCFGSGLRVVLLLVLALTLAVGADDPAVLVTLDVHPPLVLATGQGAGSELLDQALVVRAQALEHGYKGARHHAPRAEPVAGQPGTQTAVLARPRFLLCSITALTFLL